MIDQRTIKDLELDKVKQAVASYCRTEKGRALCGRIRPYTHHGALSAELKQTSEYLGSLESGNAFPPCGFDAADTEIKLLAVENSCLTEEGFVKIYDISAKTNALITFLDEFAEYYPSVRRKLKYVYFTEGVTGAVSQVMDPDGHVKDDASARLMEIRRTISSIRSSIDKIFDADMARVRASGYLDDIGESVVDHRRVLAVTAAHRRKVQGSVIGTSKTGSIVFIEPESTVRLSRELAQAEADEKEEILKILRALTDEIRPYAELLTASQKLLTEMDLLQAKARYAQSIGACLPAVTKDFKINLRQAYHPVLLTMNKAEGKPTFPQDITFSPSQRIIAISGPNAGGKSITLKTIGLLQLMLQCGLLVPVHPSSTMCFFDNVITDIGDNQSIENHLSTYSYRLKNMAGFLKVCDDRTLFLIDEFGTGSDPDLGGALAAVFLEEFYNRGAYGVLTTHYTNIKLMVEDMPEAVNASMLFDEKTLRPMYKLFIGQAGSSFTFEVALMNGIPKALIRRAKDRVEHDKIVLERTIASLQKEKSNIVEQSRSLSSARKKAASTAEALERTNEKITSKLEAYQQLYDRNVKRIQTGRRIEALADAYFFKKQTKKDVITEVMKIIEVENAKKAEAAAERLREKEKQKAAEDEKERQRAIARERRAMAEERKKQLEREKAIEEQIQKEIQPIREEKAAKEAEDEERRKQDDGIPLAPGDRVRLSGGFSVGTIDRIEKGVAHVDYGWFITQVGTQELELVERKKRGK